jgi:hypothetical protein
VDEIISTGTSNLQNCGKEPERIEFKELYKNDKTAYRLPTDKQF